jgi:hypothetical protein
MMMVVMMIAATSNIKKFKTEIAFKIVPRMTYLMLFWLCCSKVDLSTVLRLCIYSTRMHCMRVQLGNKYFNDYTGLGKGIRFGHFSSDLRK